MYSGIITHAKYDLAVQRPLADFVLLARCHIDSQAHHLPFSNVLGPAFAAPTRL